MIFSYSKKITRIIYLESGHSQAATFKQNKL